MREPCPNSPTGKHSWTFVRNAQKGQITHGPTGSHGQFWVVGLYACACGATRTGKVKNDQPGADVRDHLPGVFNETQSR